MNFFDLLTLFGGLAMFLYGIKLMGNALKESSSGTFKVIIEHITNNPVKAFLLGAFLTALIQSSKATIVITAGLVGAGILSFKQSLGIIVGANVGTTITGQIIRLLDLNAGGSWLQIFQPSSLAPIALIIGVVIIMGVNFKNSKAVGDIAIGFGILFTGLLNMTTAVSAFSDSGILLTLFSRLGTSPVLGYFSGATIAFILQSSSASVGILQAFSASGALTFNAIYPVIVGIYLGDCLTTAIVIFIGSNAPAKRVGTMNIIFNLFKSTLVFIGIAIAHQMHLFDGLWTGAVNSGIIANANTVFNLASAIVLFPLLSVFEKWSYQLIKDEEVPTNKYADKLEALSSAFFSMPALALNSCYDLLLAILKDARENVDRSLSLMNEYDDQLLKTIVDEEHNIDYLKDQVSHYIVELLPHISEEYHVAIVDQYHKMTSEFEHLGDIAIYISEVSIALHENNKELSSSAKAELKVLTNLLDRILDETTLAFEKRDIEAAYRIEPLTSVVDDVVDRLKSKHLQRIRLGQCDAEVDADYMNLLANIKRGVDICSNIGFATLLRANPELASQEHDYFHDLKSGKNQQYNTIYEEAYHEYVNQLSMIEDKE